MLTRADLKALQAHRDYPSISILAPTHRSWPANKQDRIRVKNLVTKAIDRLHEEFRKREVAEVVRNLRDLVEGVDWQHTLDGLALFASRSKAASVRLPFKVKPRLLIDETFGTRDLVHSLNRAEPYRVLSLGHTTRLYDGWTSVLEEHKAPPFPLVHRGPGGVLRLPGGRGISRSAVRDDARRKVFRSVAAAVAALQKERRLPLVVVGVERNLAFYQEVAVQSRPIAALLAGNHERTTPSSLGKLVWPLFELGATIRRTDALVRLDRAVGAQRSAAGIDDVWAAVVNGTCRTLMVEADYAHRADLSPAGDRLLKYSGKGARALDDVVDEAIERVMEAGGDVFFYGTGTLESHQRIAAVLRG